MKKILLIILLTLSQADILCQQAGYTISQYGNIYDDETEAVETMEKATSDVFNYCPSRELTIMGELFNTITEAKKACAAKVKVKDVLGENLLLLLKDANLTDEKIVEFAKEVKTLNRSPICEELAKAN